VDDRDLYHAVHEGKWDESRLLLNRTDALRLVQCESRTLLAASLWNAPLDIMQSIIDFDSSQVTCQDHNGCTPLHYACYEASDESVDKVVMLMLSVAPHAAAIPNTYDGDLPLHTAIKERRLSSVIRRLLIIHPTAVYKEDRYNRIPLSDLIHRWKWRVQQSVPEETRWRWGFPEETFLLLIRAHAHGTVDEKAALTREWLPLHEAFKIKCIKIPSKFLRILVDKMHIECVKLDEDLNFPLHLACAARS